MQKGEVAADSAATDLLFDADPTPREWDELVARWGGELLQSWGWGEFKSRTGWTASRVICRRAGKPIAAAQWLRRRVPFLGSLAYVPRGPVLAPSESHAAPSVLQYIARTARRDGAFALWVEPPWEKDSGPTLPSAFTATPDFIQPPATGFIDLRPAAAEILAGFQSNMRRNVRTASRRGLAVRAGRSEADWREFYTLLAETAARDGFGIHTWPYFATMRDVLETAGLAKLFLAEHAGKPVGGLLLTVYGNTAAYLFGASATDARDLRVGHGLQWHAIIWAKEHGCTTYDLWGMPAATRTTDPLAGVYRFKRGFNPSILHYAPTVETALRPRRYWLWRRLAPLARKLLPGL